MIKMLFFLKLALRSIIKNKRGSITIIVVVFICVFFMEFTVGYMDGFIREMVSGTLKNFGHIVIYNKEYHDNLDFAPFEFNISYDENLKNTLMNHPEIIGIRPEINFGSIADCNGENIDAFIKAIDLKNKDEYSDKIKSVIKGKFIENDKEFVIGYKAAELLKADIGDSIILLTIDSFGSMNAIEGKIVGIMKTYLVNEDSKGIICSLATAQKLLGLEGKVTEIYLTVKNFMGYNYKIIQKIEKLKNKAKNTKNNSEKQKILKELNIKYPLIGAEKVAAEIEKKLPSNLVAIPWQKDQAFLLMAISISDIWIYIIIGIIIFVASMGITNSFLMNIMGRMQEFGVLRAMGLSTKQMFGMIISESFLLGVIGSIAGLIPGIILVYYFQVHPIDYSSMSDAFETYKGVKTIIGAYFTLKGAIMVFITGLLVSVFASIYPAFVAIKKKPVEILRMIT